MCLSLLSSLAQREQLDARRGERERKREREREKRKCGRKLSAISLSTSIQKSSRVFFPAPSHFPTTMMPALAFAPRVAVAAALPVASSSRAAPIFPAKRGMRPMTLSPPPTLRSALSPRRESSKQQQQRRPVLSVLRAAGEGGDDAGTSNDSSNEGDKAGKREKEREREREKEKERLEASHTLFLLRPPFSSSTPLDLLSSFSPCRCRLLAKLPKKSPPPSNQTRPPPPSRRSSPDAPREAGAPPNELPPPLPPRAAPAGPPTPFGEVGSGLPLLPLPLPHR